MPKLILRFLALSISCAAGAFGQAGTFGQIAYGGSWQTTFTLMNLNSSSPATVTLSFFADDGSPLSAPVQNFGSNSSTVTFSIPAGGAQNIVLSSLDTTTVQGWASMSATGGTVRGQGTFRVQLPKGGISEAVVPLSFPPGSIACVVPFPTQGDPIILVPFDNTDGQYLTSLAFANATTVAQVFFLEFDDQSNNPLITDILPMTPRQHEAFVTTVNYPILQGKKGILRIHADPAKLTVLGILSNLTSTGAITTIIPVNQ